MANDGDMLEQAVLGHTLTVDYRLDAAVLELTLASPTTPTFSISALETLDRAIDELCSKMTQSKHPRIRYVHLCSSDPRVFSMGGDLQTIARLARDRDLEGALSYGHKAAHVIFGLWNSFGLDLITTACVRGKAYGAGFEAVLACNRAVCHRDASFCLPEQRFGLFPGMGATSLLRRRVGVAAMESLIAERTVLTATQAHRDGLIETLTEADPALFERNEAAIGGEARWMELMDRQHARKLEEAFSLDEVLQSTTEWAQRVVTLAPDQRDALERVAAVQRSRSRPVVS